MLHCRDPQTLAAAFPRPVVAIGSFDGLHLGHEAALATARARAEAEGAPLALLTFEPHPRRFFQPEAPPFRLTLPAARLARARALGVDAILALRFNAGLAGMAAEDFADRILKGALNATAIAAGEGFRFGAGRGGDLATLARAGLEVLPVAPLCDASGEVISASRVRSRLTAQDPAGAAALLGRHHAVSGRIQRGFQRGRALGMATANLRLPPRALQPSFGIYAVRAELSPEAGPREAEGPQGPEGHERGPERGPKAVQEVRPNATSNEARTFAHTFEGVASLGLNPTFGLSEPLLETHLFAESELPDLYGRRLSVSLVAWLREERAFSSAEALAQEMEQDTARAKAALRP